MKLVILESPFAGNNQQHIEYAQKCVTDCLISFDESPIASHLLYTQANILDDSIPYERALGIAAGLAWYAVAEACVVYIDHGISEGMIKGIRRAYDNGIPIHYRSLYER